MNRKKLSCEGGRVVVGVPINLPNGVLSTEQVYCIVLQYAYQLVKRSTEYRESVLYCLAICLSPSTWSVRTMCTPRSITAPSTIHCLEDPSGWSGRQLGPTRVHRTCWATDIVFLRFHWQGRRQGEDYQCTYLTYPEGVDASERSLLDD